MLLQNLYVPFSMNNAFTHMQVTYDAMGTNKPPYHHRCSLCAGNNLDGPFPLYMLSMFSSKTFEMWTYQTTAHFSKVFLSQYSKILYTSMSVFNRVLSEGSRVTSIQRWFLTLPLPCMILE